MIQRIESLFEYDSKNRIFLKRKRLTELNPSFHPQKRTPLFNMTRRIEPFLFSNMTQRIEFFILIDSKKNWTGFLEYDSKNWERILSKMTRRIELFFNMSQWIEPFSWIWPTELNLFSIWLKEFWFFQKLWLTELNLFAKKNDAKNVLKSQKMTPRIDFFEYNSQNWTFFLTWLTELNPFFQQDS